MSVKLWLKNVFSRLATEYYELSNYLKKKPKCKVVEVSLISEVPGETVFRVQIFGRNTFPKFTASKLINEDPELVHFSEYDRELIRAAAHGKILDFLNKNISSGYGHRVVAKEYDRKSHKYIFSIVTKDGLKLIRTTEEICKNKLMLEKMSSEDLIDIGYSKAEEDIAEEYELLQKAKLEKE